MRWLVAGRELDLESRTWVMGVLNVTPDSFSDGGRYLDPEAAIARGMALFEAGADVVAVGGRARRPDGPPLQPETDANRIVPVLVGLGAGGAGLLSDDT